MTEREKERLWTSLLWGTVAGAGQYTGLFLTIIQRIHVRFENEAPVFYVDPRGPILLTKSMALSIVWLMTVGYGIIVTLLVYFRPSLNRNRRAVIGFMALLLAAVAALAEPLWGLIVLADFAILYPILTGTVGTIEERG
jgi:hypothetical protein